MSALGQSSSSSISTGNLLQQAFEEIDYVKAKRFEESHSYPMDPEVLAEIEWMVQED